MAQSMYLPVPDYVERLWPRAIMEPPSLEALADVWMEPLAIRSSPSLQVRTALLFRGELALGIPGVDAVKLAIAPQGEDTAFMLQFDAEPTPRIRVLDVPFALRFADEILKPAKREGPPGEERVVADPERDHVDVELGRITLGVDFEGGIELSGAASIDLPLSLIGDTGIAIEAQDIAFHGDPASPPAGRPAGWRGVAIANARLYLPGELAGTVGSLAITNATIGNGGFSGTVSNTWTPRLGVTLFGFRIELSQVSLTFVQNALTGSSITGRLTLPFFEQPVDVGISINLDGSFGIALSSSGGLASVSIPGVCDLQLDALAIEGGETPRVRLSGKLRPTIPGLTFPAIELRDLTIDADGNVQLPGGWIDLPSQFSLDLFGFQLEITRLGFGKTDDGGSWIGFSGGLKLVDGMPAGASVDGLRVTWYDDGRPVAVTLNGVGVEFEVPGAVRFKGKVSYRELTVGGEEVHRFDGDISLDLVSLGLEIDATLVIGTAEHPVTHETYTFFAIYLGVELPAGIPLWTTGLGLYGLAGLFALNMEPDKRADEEWYGIGAGEGWYKRPDVGVTDLTAKWRNQRDSVALGAGVTVGTVADNGFTFAGKVLLAIVFPGPILLIEGKANLLKERAALDDEPLFRALAVLDARAGSFLVGLDAQYKVGAGGELLDIRAGAEAFFDFDDPSAWHLYLGKREPREQRIRAEIFKLWEANAYLMLDAQRLATGAWVGYDAHWRFGPLSVGLEAWLEANAALSWKPPHLSGDVHLHGEIELRAFGFGLGLTADAMIAAEVFDPFHLLATLSVAINLPWPLPDLEAEVELEWGPTPTPPPLPMPLKEIAVEHFKASVSWPLERGTLLLPDYDAARDGFRDQPGPDPAPVAAAAPPGGVPVVPLDARPHITFGRAVHDDALVGVNAQPVTPQRERVGDPTVPFGPAEVRYALKEVELAKRSGGGWVTVARKAASANPAGVPTLFGSWAALPALPAGTGDNTGQTKLWLWSRSPFDWSARADGAWEEWFSSRFTNYPCPELPPTRRACCDFSDLRADERPSSPWRCDDAGFEIRWAGKATVVELDIGRDETVAAICVPATRPSQSSRDREPNWVEVVLDEPAGTVEVWAHDIEATLAEGYDAEGNAYGPVYGGPDNLKLVVEGKDLVRVRVRGWARLCLMRVCVTVPPDPELVDEVERVRNHVAAETARWSQTGAVLEPNASYRLRVVTNLEAVGVGELAGWSQNLDQTEFAYFRTEGPPGLAALSVPAGHPSPGEFQSGLDDLTRYVRQTTPATVPAPGEQPPLPRPVYRAYDVGVEFNEDYVDLMYRMSGRDLGLYVLDANGRPARSAEGLAIVPVNRWGRTETLTLAGSAETWVTRLETSTCTVLDRQRIPHDVTLDSVTPDQVLLPEALHEARLVPLLLHEDFRGHAVGAAATGPSGTLGRWRVAEAGSAGGPSQWRVGEETGPPATRHLAQAVAVAGGDADLESAHKPGTVLLLGDDPALPGTHASQPGQWTDFRLSVVARAAGTGAFGVVVRHRDANTFYRFAMDRAGRRMRLVRRVAGAYTVLAEVPIPFQPNRDYRLAFEAIGEELLVALDGRPVLRAVDGAIPSGRCGLYTYGDAQARFAEVRVDDFRPDAVTAYRFAFTTSRYPSFAAQAHSFQDEAWTVQATADVSATGLTVVAPPVAGAVTDGEARAFAALATQAGFGGREAPGELQVARVVRGGATRALLLTCPEPLDPRRTTVRLLRAPGQPPPGDAPAEVKLVRAGRASAAANQEFVEVLQREAGSLTGTRIEQRALPGPLDEEPPREILLRDDFDADDAGFLFRETFGPTAMDHYDVVDEGDQLGPSNWGRSGSWIRQNANLFGGSLDPAVPAKPGTMALFGEPTWTDVRIAVTLRSTDDDAIGLAFRVRDPQNLYRFSMDRERGYRRLVKHAGGTVTTLWEDAGRFVTGQAYRLVVEAAGDRLLGWLDDRLLFDVRDTAHPRGRAGLYSWLNTGAHFGAISVEALRGPVVLWRPELASVAELEVVDPEHAVGGPSAWSATGGVLTETSGVTTADATALQPGTCALGGLPEWEDVRITARLSASAGALGLVCRYAPNGDHYRFALDGATGRRLVKVRGGVATVLWQDATLYAPGTAYDVTVTAVGRELRVAIDGAQVCSVRDADLARGMAGVYARACPTARFERLLVADRTRRLGQWTVHDAGYLSGPSRWRIAHGMLSQEANVLGLPDLDAPGTQAVGGDPGWTDVRFSATLRSDDDDAIGIVFRYADAANHYRLSFDQQRATRRLVRVAGGVSTLLWQSPGGFVTGMPFSVVLDAVGDRLTCRVDGAPLFDVRDATHAAGRVGLWCWANNGARFDAVEVRLPPLEARALLRDRFAEGDRSAFTIVDAGTTSAPSAWSVTADGELRQASNIHELPDDRDTLPKRGTMAVAGDPAWRDVVLRVRLRALDDDAIGVAFRHQDASHYYRFSMDRQRRYRRLVKNVGGTFTSLWEDDGDYETGRAYELVIVARGPELRGYLDGVPLFSVRDGDLEQGNVALYCWANTDARFSDVLVLPDSAARSDWLLTERFNALVRERWSFVDEGDTGGPSAWAVADRRLVQSSGLGTSAGAADVHRAGALAVAGDPTWTDYRVSVRLESGTTAPIGILGRYRDEDNWYRLAFDRAAGRRRLVRMAAGAATVLWEDTGTWASGRPVIATLDFAGDRITGWLDGRRLFSLEDDAHAAGAIGLYCSSNADARLSDVVVGAAGWSTWYEFGAERRRPAGSRVRVHAGSAATPVAAVPGAELRYAAGPGTRGRARLGAGPVDLRLVSPSGQRGHRRTFLADDAFAEVAFRAARRPDGTACWLLPHGAASFPAGTYRLELGYRRDNRTADPGSRVLTQNGDGGAEAVVLDVPWAAR